MATVRYAGPTHFTANKLSENWVKRHEGGLKLLLATLGVLIGVNEYLQRQYNNRVQQSLRIIERYQSKEVLEARLRIDRLWNSEEFWNKLLERHEDSGRLYYDSIQDLAVAFIGKRDHVDDLFVVWTSSTEASLCLGRGQCDQFTICTNFFHDTQKYYYFFQPYFDAKNEAWDEVTQGRDEYTVSVVNEYCGNTEFLNLYNYDCQIYYSWACQASKYLRRYFHETFNNPVGL